MKREGDGRERERWKERELCYWNKVALTSLSHISSDELQINENFLNKDKLYKNGNTLTNLYSLLFDTKNNELTLLRLFTNIRKKHKKGH